MFVSHDHCKTLELEKFLPGSSSATIWLSDINRIWCLLFFFRDKTVLLVAFYVLAKSYGIAANIFSNFDHVFFFCLGLGHGC